MRSPVLNDYQLIKFKITKIYILEAYVKLKISAILPFLQFESLEFLFVLLYFIFSGTCLVLGC